MEIRFTKMQGCGNDYVYIDCHGQEITEPGSLAKTLADRHYGIGGDGIVLILPSSLADAKMRMFNADGSEGGMCGNAIRCVAKHLYESRIVSSLNMSIETLSGIKTLTLYTKDGLVSSVKVDMGAAVLTPGDIPVRLPGDSVIAKTVDIAGSTYSITCVSMGNPHAVVFSDDVQSIDVHKIGPLFEGNELFPDRVNTEFVQVIGKNRLKMRVWERGSGLTLACGTGACAAAVAAVLNGYCDEGDDITVQLDGGELIINYTPQRVLMAGDCKKVFEGMIQI